jgi:hypothetical protein
LYRQDEGGYRMNIPRSWIWVALIIQWIGWLYDAVWHELISPHFEAATRPEMAHHLRTVHVPLYIGVAATLLATAWALLEHVRHREHGMAIPIAFAGAVIQVVGEIWHAYSHLQLSAHVFPLTYALSFVGMLIVLGALVFGRPERGDERVLTHS